MLLSLTSVVFACPVTFATGLVALAGLLSAFSGLFLGEVALALDCVVPSALARREHRVEDNRRSAADAPVLFDASCSVNRGGVS